MELKIHWIELSAKRPDRYKYPYLYLCFDQNIRKYNKNADFLQCCLLYSLSKMCNLTGQKQINRIRWYALFILWADSTVVPSAEVSCHS